MSMIAKFIISLITIAFASCSTTPSEVKAPQSQRYNEDDVQRVNAPYILGYTQILRPASAGTPFPDGALDAFQRGTIEPGEKIYSNYWTLYQYFLGGDVQSPESTVCLHHNVHFFLSEGDAASSRRRRKQARPVNVESLGDEEFLEAQTKDCGDPQSAARVVSFQLFNYHQPNAVRNFLVLAKAGFFDGRDLVISKQAGDNLMVGQHGYESDPFVYAPDSRFADTPARGSDRDYLGAVVYNPARIDVTRTLMPWRVVMVDRPSAQVKPAPSDDEEVLEEPASLPIGQLYTPFANSVKDLREMYQKGRNWRVVCTAIDMPAVANFSVAANECPLVSDVSR